jgi:DNA polymerase/3'-5' exonuclease PolX
MSPTPEANFDLSSVPPIHILATHLTSEELHEYEDLVFGAHGSLTYSSAEARVFLARISQKKRAAFELRSNSVWTEEAKTALNATDSIVSQQRSLKRKHSSTSSSAGSTSESSILASKLVEWPDMRDTVVVIRLDWLDACIKMRRQVPYGPYLVYTGRLVSKPNSPKTSRSSKDSGVVTYIKADAASSSQSRSGGPPPPRPFSHSRTMPSITKRSPPKLSRTTTSEMEDTSDSNSSNKLPPLPEWATSETQTYACCRLTPPTCPNDTFLCQLQEIKLGRILTLDAIGVRAYSTSIASIAAYPHRLTSHTELLRLPGCNSRIAELWQEWYESATNNSERSIAAVRELLADPDQRILRHFYEIWGVGADTAQKLLYTHNLRDLDDIVEYHWSGLNRVQQIGVKFYEEFQQKIPRAEVEEIAATILRHARLVKGIGEAEWGTTADMECVIVGGYRRGKAESGDVDVILSHRDENVTRDLVIDVVRSLETEGWITHTLTLQTTNSDRDQQTLPFRGEGHGGHGFDSLDKALCVWQNPQFDTQGSETRKNPNIHRRVDIILSPWRTVGCAILGWSGGTTFQRDLRRFASKVKGWKFDSSGVRDRGTGVVVDLEGDAKTWEERERRVMEGIGIGWRPASERCTG